MAKQRSKKLRTKREIGRLRRNQEGKIFKSC